MEKIRLSKYNPMELVKNMGWFSRLCLVGSILMLIDSFFEILTSPFGTAVLILSIIIILLSPQISDDNPNALYFIIIVLVLSSLIQFWFHEFVGINWFIGLGLIGNILINIGASIALFLIIVSIAASDIREPIKDLWLYLIGFIMVGVNLLVYLSLTDYLLDTRSMLAILYFSLIVICTILKLLGQKIMPGLVIGFISFINLFGLGLSTPISGFGAGMSIIGTISFLYFVNEFGYFLTGTFEKKEK